MRRTSSPTASKGAVLTAPRPAVSNRWRGLVVTALFLALLPALAAAPDDQVKLIEAGAEPRKELRLHPKPGDKQTAVMTIKVAIDLNIGEMPPQAIKLPAIKITSDITVKSISAEGDIIYDLLIRNASAADDPGATPLVVEPIKSALAAIQGLSGTGTLSSRGLSKALEIEPPAGTAPQTLQAIDEIKECLAMIVSPLPKEPVGVGGRWEVKTPVKSQGMKVSQTTTYQLASLEGDRPALKSTIEQRASTQKVKNPALPGITLNLSKMAGKGAGSVTLDLAQTLPPGSSADIDTELDMAMDAGGQPQPVTMKIETHLGFEAK